MSRCSALGVAGRGLRIQRSLAGFLEQPQQQRNRQSRGREGDDQTGDHQRLRYGIAVQPGSRTPPRNDAEQQENTAAEQVERQNFTQRPGIDDQAEQSQTDQDHAAQPKQGRRADHDGSLAGGPAMSRPSATAIERVNTSSIVRMNGLA